LEVSMLAAYKVCPQFVNPSGCLATSLAI